MKKLNFSENIGTYSGSPPTKKSGIKGANSGSPQKNVEKKKKPWLKWKNDPQKNFKKNPIEIKKKKKKKKKVIENLNHYN